ncbi:MAG: choice-of-anchor D domain-containing protein [Planctomycetes bacterium]|nr:choice-of-anchor D domain-containing protein [Planctomycetota bacterium]
MKVRFHVLLIALFFTSMLISCDSGDVDVKFSLKNHDFGAVNIGDNDTVDIIITNKKSDPLTLTLMSINNIEFIIITGGTPGTLIQGKAEHTVTVQFTPTLPGGVKDAILQIDYDFGTKPKIKEITLNGEAVPVPRFQVGPASKDYGTVNCNTTETQDFTVENIGTSDLNVFAPSLSGAASAMYEITAGTTGGLVAPGNVLIITVEFTPTSDGNKVAVLEIPHDGVNIATPVSLNLEGIGATPQIDCSPNPFDFGTVYDGAIKIMNIEVENAGTGYLTISAVNITGANASEFVLMNALPINVNAGVTAQVPVMFNPTAVGQRGPVSATFVNNTGTPEVVVMNGECVANPPGNGSNDYTFSQFTRGMTRIVAPTYVYTSRMDDGSVNIPIGFTFPFYGQNWTRLAAGSNGGVIFSNSATYLTLSNRALPSTSAPNNLIAGWWDDLYYYYSNSRWYYKTTGSAPNRVFTVEYYDFTRC